jgi:hypothetical protein
MAEYIFSVSAVCKCYLPYQPLELALRCVRGLNSKFPKTTTPSTASSYSLYLYICFHSSAHFLIMMERGSITCVLRSIMYCQHHIHTFISILVWGQTLLTEHID